MLVSTMVAARVVMASVTYTAKSPDELERLGPQEAVPSFELETLSITAPRELSFSLSEVVARH